MRPRYGLLVMCKPLTMETPQLYRELADIMERDGSGEILAERYWLSVPTERLEELYAEHEGKPFFGQLTHAFDGSDSRTWMYATNDPDPGKWVNHVRKDLIGVTCMEEANPGSFRKRIHEVTGIRVKEKQQRREYFDTGVHCSDSAESGRREGRIFYRDYPHRGVVEFLFD
jgi:nucleoside diphosphate kinase